MDPRRLLDDLSSVALKLGLEVRVEPFASPGRSAGGLCVVHGRQVVLIDAGARPVEQAASLAEALGGFELEGVHMAPEARRFIEQRREHGAWQREPAASRRARDNVAPLPLPKPGLRSTKPDRKA